MLIYSIVKGFEGEFTHIQRNAIRSWQEVCPEDHIFLFGDAEPNALKEAVALGVPILPMVYTTSGAPLLPDVIQKMHKMRREGDTLCLINADIVLEPQFAAAAQTVESKLDNFLLITRRRNVQVDDELDFSKDWHGALKALPFKDYTRSGIDVFCYRGDWLKHIPSFGVGRTAWDNWIVGWARRQKVPIVEATQFTIVYHQGHAKHKPADEVRRNQELWNKTPTHKDFKQAGTLDSATWILTEDGNLTEKRK